MNVNAVLVERLGSLLLKRHSRVAVAESCTGGWIAKYLTDLPGSSAWFEYGFVTYGDNAKIGLLGLDPALIAAQGAVSEAVATAMARGAAARAGADFAVAVTGIAGPDGGSADKPVGTVWFAWQAPGTVAVTKCHVFQGDRDTVRRQTVSTALTGLVRSVERAGR